MLTWFFLLTLFSLVQSTEVSVFSFNVKGGRKGRQVCCWTSGPGKNEEKHVARQWMMDKMKAEVSKKKYDFLSLVETRDEKSGYPDGKNGCTKVAEILAGFPGYGAAKQSPWGWNCNTILYDQSKWKLDEDAQAQHWTCANSEVQKDDRVMAAARFSATSGDVKVVVVSIQYPHLGKPYPNIEYIQKIKELAENGKWPVIFAGDMNMGKRDLEGRMGKSGWPAKSSADHPTCCADNNFGAHYDHIAVMADDKQGWTISVEANILPGWGKDDSYTFSKIRSQAKMSAEHLPVAGTVTFEKGAGGGGSSGGGPSPAPPVTPPVTPPADGVCGGGTRDCDRNFAPANQKQHTCTSRANWVKNNERKSWTDARCKIYGEYKTECSCYFGQESHVAETLTIPIKVASAAKLIARLDVRILVVGVSVLVAILLFLRAKKHAQNPGSYHALLDVDEEEI